MEKFKKYYKIPLLVVSALLFVAFLTVIIVQSCSHYSNGKYVYKAEMAGVRTEAILTIDGKKGTAIYEVAVYAGTESERDTQYIPYEIKGDKIFLLTDNGEVADTMEITPYSVTDSNGSLEIELVNKGARALLGCSIAFASLGAIGLAVTTVLIVLDKKKTNKTEKVENTEKAEKAEKAE